MMMHSTKDMIHGLSNSTGLHYNKKFCFANDNKNRRQDTDLEKILSKTASDKGLLYKICKPIKLNNK